MKQQQKSNEDLAYIYSAGGTMLMGYRDRIIQGLNKNGKHIKNATGEYNNVKNDPIFQRMVLAFNKLGKDKAVDYVIHKQHSGWWQFVYQGKPYKEATVNESNVKHINESQLKTIVAESVKKILKEYEENMSDDDFEHFMKHDFATSPEGRALSKRISSPEFIAKAQRNFEREILGNQKYFTPEQAKMMGYKPDEYQDTTKEYLIWRRGRKEAIKVKDPSFVKKGKRSPSADWDGSDYIDKYKHLKLSRLNNIVSESIKKMLENQQNDFHHTEVGENPLMKGRYGVNSIPYGDMGHFDGTLQQCKNYAPDMERAAEERFQKDIQHAIEMGMSEEEMNKILHDTYSRRGKYIPSVNNGNVSWDEKK